MNIWLYWEDCGGREKPEYLKLCFETVQRHCAADFAIRIVSRPEALQMLDLPPAWADLAQVAHRADMVRAGLLAKYGGIWLDSDLIVIKSLRFLIEEIRAHGFVGYCPYEPGNPEIGFLGALPSDPIVTSWFEEMKRQVVEKSGTKLGWLDLGQNILKKYTQSHRYWKDYSHRYFSPILGCHKQRFLTEGSIREFLFPETHTIMLFNHGFGNHPIKAMNREQILASKLVLADAIRLGLGDGKCPKPSE